MKGAAGRYPYEARTISADGQTSYATVTYTTAVAVTGAVAVGIDVSDKLNAALLPYLILVMGLA